MQDLTGSAVLSLLRQMAIQVILVTGAMTIKSSLLFDQTVRVIVDAVGFTPPLIFNVSQQEPVVIITVAKLAAVRLMRRVSR